MPSSQMTTNYDLGYNGYKANFKMIENYIGIMLILIGVFVLIYGLKKEK